jgi:hypothetical protein
MVQPPPVVPEELTVRAMVVVALVEPEVPVMVIVELPTVAVALAVSVRVPPLNAAVTPPGRPEAAKVTVPLNPFTSVTVMVSVAVLP